MRQTFKWMQVAGVLIVIAGVVSCVATHALTSNITWLAGMTLYVVGRLGLWLHKDSR